MMPVMNGWEFLHNFRNNQTVRDIPVVVCSAAKANLSDVEFLKKPIDLSHLVHVVQDHFQASKIVSH
jgi:CheY-like chemotaxis protein